ncbi:hypothetical protein chiPu_0028118, partial [Chiloscyllium punctatum]|nr:hypothetical protein [Chiloscyllium punctatum]
MSRPPPSRPLPSPRQRRPSASPTDPSLAKSARSRTDP